MKSAAEPRLLGVAEEGPEHTSLQSTRRTSLPSPRRIPRLVLERINPGAPVCDGEQRVPESAPAKILPPRG
jgi:hypothetical protein